MNTYILEKRTTEEIWFDIDCTNILNDSEIIASISSIDSDQAGLIFLGEAINPNPVNFSDGHQAKAGSVISLQIKGGIIQASQTNQLYTIRAVFVTNESNIKEATVLLNVTNIPSQTGREC